MTNRMTSNAMTLTTTRLLAWVVVALFVFLAVAGASARPVRAASVAPVAHEGNVTEKDNGCPSSDTVIVVDGGVASGSGGGVTIHVTYHDNNSLDFSATGGVVDIAYVKGGPNFNEYDYDPAVTSDTNLVAPLNGGNQVPAVSHSAYCVQPNETTTSTSQTSSSSSSTETTSSSSTSETTETTETSDVSETTATTQTTSDGTSTTETGGVGAETGRPEVTPPSTSTIVGSSGSSDGWRIILLVLAGIAALSLILVPSRQKKQR
jgi:hypothetical protein